MRVIFFLLIYLILFNFVVRTNRQLDKYFYLLGSINTILEFSIFSVFFFKITASAKFKKIIIGITSLTCGYLLFSIFTSPSDDFDSIPAGLTSLVLLIYSIYYLFERMSDPTSLDIFSSPIFWVVVAVMIFAAGTFFPFLYAKNNIEDENFRSSYDLIHDTLYIVKNVIFSFAIMTRDNRDKHRGSKKH
ncbi:MAG: hypothetical protein QM763_25190 [Agriterribacter sp.]